MQKVQIGHGIFVASFAAKNSCSAQIVDYRNWTDLIVFDLL